MNITKYKEYEYKLEAPGPTQPYWAWKFYLTDEKRQWEAGRAKSRADAERDCKRAIEEFLDRIAKFEHLRAGRSISA
jgi:hypothetical protein